VNRRQALGTLALALVTPRSVKAQSRAGQVSLYSPVLELAFRPSPYHFDVIERSTGKALLSHRATGWRTGSRILNGPSWAVSADDVESGRETVAARLRSESARATPLDVSFQFVTPEILKVTLRVVRTVANATHSNVSITESFVDAGESIYGLFEAAWPRRTSTGAYSRERGLDNRGVEADLLGNGMHKWFDGMRYSSARTPFYLTSAGYGIYVQSVWKGRYRLAVDQQTSFEFDDSELTYFVIYGPSYAHILSRHNALAGPSRQPPDWALGPIWWRDDSHEDLRNPEGGLYEHAQQVVLGDARELQKRRIPASAMWLDRPYARPDRGFGWGGMENGHLQFSSGFPSPAQMIDRLSAAGVKLMLWIANRSDNQMGAEGKALGYLLSTGRAVDMRNHNAYAWFQSKLEALLRHGVQGYKIDRGEENEVPEYLENYNAMLFPKMASEGLRRCHGEDHFVFARNLYDEGRKYSAVWNGDSYGWKGLRESVRQALRCGLMNFPMWGSDTGGYGETTAELYARWSQFAAYTPMMEMLIGPGRTPWLDFPRDVLDIVVEQARTKHDLIPYLRSELFVATQTGMPVMRPLVLAYPSDPAVGDLSDEYLFGSEILVAPVLHKGARSRSAYLPEGQWLDYNDKSALYPGGRQIRLSAPLSRVPVLVREGAIIPRGDILKGNNTWSKSWEPTLRVELFPSSRFESEFRYYTGRTQRRIRSRPAQRALVLDVEDLEAKGQLDVYCHPPETVVSNGQPLEEGTDYSYEPARRLLQVPLSGATHLELVGVRSGFNHLSVF
jgi:alpha-glucosidase (family GH31 glycosyl hydrolase)